MKNHTDLLNYLITAFNLQSYLEIGVHNPANNFDKIELPIIRKFGVDPDDEARAAFIGTSDEYFEKKWERFPDVEYDLIFIDGLHHADQVRRDFENSLKCLSDNGFIVIHDTLPTEEKYTHVPRDSKIWFGDVWKFAVTLGDYKGIDFITLDFDCGCTVVWKNKLDYQPNRNIKATNWNEFQQNKKYLLRIFNVVYFKEHLIDYFEAINNLQKNILTE